MGRSRAPFLGRALAHPRRPCGRWSDRNALLPARRARDDSARSRSRDVRGGVLRWCIRRRAESTATQGIGRTKRVARTAQPSKGSRAHAARPRRPEGNRDRSAPLPSAVVQSSPATPNWIRVRHRIGSLLRRRPCDPRGGRQPFEPPEARELAFCAQNDHATRRRQHCA